MAGPAPIQVEGLIALQRGLRSVDKDLPKSLRKANMAAAELVSAATRRSFASRPGVAPKVAPSVKAKAQQRSASVKIGGSRYPYAAGSEFGGGKHKAGNPTRFGGYTTQFPAWRGRDEDAGYSLFPSLRAKRSEVVEQYADAVHELIARALITR